MSTTTQPGGFIGDPVEAFTPPAASGCCGSAPATTESATSGGCCGSTEATTARQEAVDAGAGCCG